MGRTAMEFSHDKEASRLAMTLDPQRCHSEGESEMIAALASIAHSLCELNAKLDVLMEADGIGTDKQ